MLSCPALRSLPYPSRKERAEGRQGGGTASRPPATGHATAPARQRQPQPQPRAPQPAAEPGKPRRRLPQHRRRPRPFPFPAGEAQRRASPPPPGPAPPPLAATYRAPDLSRLPPPHHRVLSPQPTRPTAGGGRATPGCGGGRASPHRPPRPHSGTRPGPPPGGGQPAAAILAAPARHSLPAGGAPGAGFVGELVPHTHRARVASTPKMSDF